MVSAAAPRPKSALGSVFSGLAPSSSFSSCPQAHIITVPMPGEERVQSPDNLKSRRIESYGSQLPRLEPHAILVAIAVASWVVREDCPSSPRYSAPGRSYVLEGRFLTKKWENGCLAKG